MFPVAVKVDFFNVVIYWCRRTWMLLKRYCSERKEGKNCSKCNTVLISNLLKLIRTRLSDYPN